MGKTRKNELAIMKKKKFAALVVQTDSPMQAALQVWNFKDKASAASYGNKMMRDPEVRDLVNKALDVKGITPEYVLARIKKVADYSKKDTTRLKALELLGKYLKMFSEDSKTKFNFNIDLTNEQADKILRNTEGYTSQGEARVKVVRDSNDE